MLIYRLDDQPQADLLAMLLRVRLHSLTDRETMKGWLAVTGQSNTGPTRSSGSWGIIWSECRWYVWRRRWWIQRRNGGGWEGM